MSSISAEPRVVEGDSGSNTQSRGRTNCEYQGITVDSNSSFVAPAEPIVHPATNVFNIANPQDMSYQSNLKTSIEYLPIFHSTPYLKIWSGTWNIGAKEPSQKIADFDVEVSHYLPPDYDIYFLGIQEGRSNLVADKINDYLRQYGVSLLPVYPQVHGRGDGSFISTKFTGLFVYVADRLRPFVNILANAEVSLGITEGSKGAAGVVIQVCGTTLAVVSTHMPASSIQNRLIAHNTLLSNLGSSLCSYYHSGTYNSSAIPTAMVPIDPRHSDLHLHGLFHHVIFMGDTNFRLQDITADQVLEHIATQGKVNQHSRREVEEERARWASCEACTDQWISQSIHQNNMQPAPSYLSPTPSPPPRASEVSNASQKLGSVHIDSDTKHTLQMTSNPLNSLTNDSVLAQSQNQSSPLASYSQPSHTYDSLAGLLDSDDDSDAEHKTLSAPGGEDEGLETEVTDHFSNLNLEASYCGNESSSLSPLSSPSQPSPSSSTYVQTRSSAPFLCSCSSFQSNAHRLAAASGYSIPDPITPYLPQIGLSRVLLHDELTRFRKSIGIFYGFSEPTMSPTFFPSYKRIESRNVIDWSDDDAVANTFRTAYKEPWYKSGRVSVRVPAFTDRILIASTDFYINQSNICSLSSLPRLDNAMIAFQGFPHSDRFHNSTNSCLVSGFGDSVMRVERAGEAHQYLVRYARENSTKNINVTALIRTSSRSKSNISPSSSRSPDEDCPEAPSVPAKKNPLSADSISFTSTCSNYQVINDALYMSDHAPVFTTLQMPLPHLNVSIQDRGAPPAYVAAMRRAALDSETVDNSIFSSVPSPLSETSPSELDQDLDSPAMHMDDLMESSSNEYEVIDKSYLPQHPQPKVKKSRREHKREKNLPAPAPFVPALPPKPLKAVVLPDPLVSPVFHRLSMISAEGPMALNVRIQDVQLIKRVPNNADSGAPVHTIEMPIESLGVLYPAPYEQLVLSPFTRSYSKVKRADPASVDSADTTATPNAANTSHSNLGSSASTSQSSLTLSKPSSTTPTTSSSISSAISLINAVRTYDSSKTPTVTPIPVPTTQNTCFDGVRSGLDIAGANYAVTMPHLINELKYIHAYNCSKILHTFHLRHAFTTPFAHMVLRVKHSQFSGQCVFRLNIVDFIFDDSMYNATPEQLELAESNNDNSVLSIARSINRTDTPTRRLTLYSELLENGLPVSNRGYPVTIKLTVDLSYLVRSKSPARPPTHPSPINSR